MSKAYVTRVSLSFRVIVFSFLHDTPLDLSPYVTNVSGTKSIVGSHSDSLVLDIKVPRSSLTFQVGDWIQVDIESEQHEPEHLFFGQILSKNGSEMVSGTAGGVTEYIEITAITWGSIFLRFVGDLQTYLRTNADTLFPWRDEIKQGGNGEPQLVDLEDVDYETPPSLATIAQGRLTCHPWQAVAIVLHYLCRYGGTFGQQFWLPKSYTGLSELVPIIEYVARVSHTRLPKNKVLGSDWTGFERDENNVIKEIEKRDDEDGTFSSDVPDEKRVWPYSDWQRVFQDNRSFVPGAGWMRDFVQQKEGFGVSGTLQDLASDLSDSAFDEFFYTLQERCSLGPQTPNVAVDALTGEKSSFDRRFCMTVVLRPIPHPSWDSKKNTKILQSENGPLMFTADRSNYEKLCPKFVLTLGHNTKTTFSQSSQSAFSYFNVLPQDQEWKGMELFDAAAMLRYSSGRVPIIDEELMQTFGHQPMVPTTRYYHGGTDYYVSPTSGPSEFVQVSEDLNLPNPTGEGFFRFKLEATPFWMILASKALAIYAWHCRGAELYSGSVQMPVVNPNVPRPGDVGYLVPHVDDTGSHFRDANRKSELPNGMLSKIKTGAISVYVDSVDYSLSVNGKTSTVQGTMTIHYSHGVWCLTSKPTQSNLPYSRFVDYSEVGLDPTYFLPAVPGAVRMRDELFTEFAQVEVVKAKELVQKIEGEKDPTRNKKRRKRSKRRRRRIGLKHLGEAATKEVGIEMNFTLQKLESTDETKKTDRNPSKKAEYVFVPQYLKYRTRKETDLNGNPIVREHLQRTGSARVKKGTVDKVIIDAGFVD